MAIKKINLIMGISVFLLFWSHRAWSEEEKPTEERPAFELPEVVIIGEDQSRVIRGAEKEVLIDRPFLKKVEVGLEPMGKTFPLLFPPQKKDLNITEFSFAYGRFDSLKANLSHGRQIKDRAHYILGIGKYKTDGEFPDRWYDEDTAFLELGFKPAERLDLKIATSGLLKDYRLSNSPDTQKVDLLNMELGLENRIGEQTSLGFQVSGQIAHLKNTGKAKGETGGVRLQARVGLAEKNSLNIEAQLYQETLNLNSDRRRYSVTAFSLTDEFLLFDRLWVNLGLEYKDKSEPLTSFLYPIARFSYELLPNFNVWVRYKPELAIPIFSDLYIDNDYVAVNLDLLPQKKTFSLEEGMEYKFTENFYGNISFFQRKFRNFIALSDDGTIGNFANISDVFSQGLDVLFVYNWGEDFTHRLRYVYDKTEDEDRPDEKVPYVPYHSLEISSQYTYGRLGIELSLLMQSERYYNRSLSLPFYWALGTEVSLRVTEEFLLFLQGENLLEEKYSLRFGYPLDHSKFFGGFRVKW